MSTLIHRPVVAAALGTLLAACSLARAAPALPASHMSGDVEYLSGGIGQDEAAAIEQVARQWPLTVEFAEKHQPRADFLADVKTVVRDAQGHTVLDVDSDGPFLLARLAPGSYTIDATSADMTLHEKVVIKRGVPAKALFLWPAGTDERRS